MEAATKAEQGVSHCHVVGSVAIILCSFYRRRDAMRYITRGIPCMGVAVGKGLRPVHTAETGGYTGGYG